MRISIQLDARPGAAADRAHALAATGVDGLFTFEGPHDVFFPLVEAAPATQVELMTNIAVAPPRSALHLAHAAYDLQLISRGRFRLGLGSQIKPHIVGRYGAQWSRPAARMRETVLAVKDIFRTWETGAPLQFRGEFHHHTLMPPMFNPGPHPHRPPPVLLGALGPIMTRTAAEVADGLLVMPFNSARHFQERTLPAIADGLARADRDPAAFEVIPQVIVAMGRSAAELAAAAVGVRRLLAFYGSTPAYRPVLEVEGWDSAQPVLNALSKTGDVAAMADLVDDAMLRTLAVHGTPAECAVQILARFGAHADAVCCYFPGYDVPPEHLAELTTRLHAAPPREAAANPG